MTTILLRLCVHELLCTQRGGQAEYLRNKGTTNRSNSLSVNDLANELPISFNNQKWVLRDLLIQSTGDAKNFSNNMIRLLTAFVKKVTETCQDVRNAILFDGKQIIRYYKTNLHSTGHRYTKISIIGLPEISIYSSDFEYGSWALLDIKILI